MELSGNIHNIESGEAAVAFAREQERIRRATWRRRWITAGIVIGGLFVLMVGCGVAVGAAAGGGSATTSPTATPQASAPAVAPEPAETATAPVTPSVEAPRTWITNGDWHVGDEVAAGTYRSEGAEDAPVKLASVTVRSAAGDIVDIKTSTDGPIRITVADGQTVSVVGALPFTKVE